MVGALSDEDLDFLDSLEDAFKAHSKQDRVEEMPLVMQVKKLCLTAWLLWLRGVMVTRL